MRFRKIICIGIFALAVLILPATGFAYEVVSIKVSTPPTMDGNGDDAAWKLTKAVEFEAEDGPEMSIKSVYTDSEVFFLVSWEDDSESIYANQWVYDGQKWGIRQEVRVKGEAPRDADTDRLGFQWVINDSIKEFAEKGCKVLCHSPEKEDKMYTNSPGERTDIWLWSAAITNPLGYADDYSLNNTNISIKDETDKIKRINAAHLVDNTGGGGKSFERNNAVDKPKWVPKGGISNIQFLLAGNEVSFNSKGIKKGDSVPGWCLSRPKGSRGDINSSCKYYNFNFTSF